MTLQTRVTLLIFGLMIWIGGSIYFAYRGAQMLETTRSRYWISFFVLVVASAILALAALKVLRVAPQFWASAALLLALPGMVGEAVALSHLATFMPRLQAASGGRYGALLFAAYAAVLGIAEIVTWNAAP